MHQKRVRAEKLIAELAAHVAESLSMASAGDVEAKQWLLWAFPGNCEQFKQVWNKPPVERRHVQPERK